jgi:DNA (cytosine-5)-methyltransferase 1
VPKALDLFCKAGGAGYGLMLAGYDVTGVDIEPQPRYPGRFIQGDAFAWLRGECESLDQFALIWASPPCQLYTKATAQQRNKGVIYPDHYPAVRQLLIASGIPWILENVVGAPVDPRGWYVDLCGQSFGLRVLRHRRFEASHLIMAPPHRKHTGLKRGINADYVCVVKNAWKKDKHKDDRVAVWREAMGIDWMTKDELSEAIPPAYSRFLAEQIRGV